MSESDTLQRDGFPFYADLKKIDTTRRFLLFTVLLIMIVVYIYMNSSKSIFRGSPCSPKLSGRNFSQTLSGRNHSLADPDYNDKPGRFLYLITGEGDPGETWIVLTQQPGVYGIFASWRRPISFNITSEKLHAFFYPSSTWTTCRNFLFSKVDGFERHLGLRMHFILFADEDLVLKSRAPWNTSVHFGNSLAASLQLHRMLMRDRPSRSGVEYATFFPINEYSAECVQSCALDGALDIYHRSIIDHLMPYTGSWDRVNWHVSQLVMNLGCQALLLDGCSLYRQVFVDKSKNEHKSYPSDNSLYENVGKLMHDCLQRRGFHAAKSNFALSQQEALMRAIYRPKPTETPRKCTSAPADINYGRQLREGLERWPKSCWGTNRSGH